MSRPWSVNPRFLDVRGLGACWRESLGIQRALIDYYIRKIPIERVGYGNHPQVRRWLDYEKPWLRSAPLYYVGAYLTSLYTEAERRGYSYDCTRILIRGRLQSDLPPIELPRGQLDFELAHLRRKLTARGTWLYIRNAWRCRRNTRHNSAIYRVRESDRSLCWWEKGKQG